LGKLLVQTRSYSKLFWSLLTLRGQIGVVILILVLAGGLDVIQPPDRQISARATIYCIGLYKQYISPTLGGVVKCKFTPTCSQYAAKAIEKYGILNGGWLTIKRLARCSPFTDEHGVDDP